MYDRVLKRLQDPDLRKLAKPGLLLRRLRAGVFASVAGVFEGEQRWDEALDFWQAAASAGRNLPPMERLSFQIGRLRTLRQLGLTSRRNRLLASTSALLQTVGFAIAERRVLARETIAELGELLTSGKDPGARGLLAELFANLCGQDEIFIHASVSPERRSDVARRLGLNPEASQRELNAIATRLIFGKGPAADDLIAIIREEVQWSIQQVQRDR